MSIFENKTDRYQTKESMQYIESVIRETDIALKAAVKENQEDKPNVFSHGKMVRCGSLLGSIAAIYGLGVTCGSGSGVIASIYNIGNTADRRKAEELLILASSVLAMSVADYAWVIKRKQRELKQEKKSLYRNAVHRHMLIKTALERFEFEPKKRDSLENLDKLLCQALRDLGHDLGHEEYGDF